MISRIGVGMRYGWIHELTRQVEIKVYHGDTEDTELHGEKGIRIFRIKG
jgi:hypothetical protein